MKGLCFLISVFLLASCATLPAIQEPSADQTKKPVTCPSPFILEKTRFIHTIDVQAAGQTKAVMIGVTVADPVSRTFSCAIMSTEGMVVFEASNYQNTWAATGVSDGTSFYEVMADGLNEPLTGHLTILDNTH